MIGCFLGTHTPDLAADEQTSSLKQSEVDGIDASPNDPIERLRQRSALDRWKSLSDGWTNRRQKSVEDQTSTSGPRMLPLQTAPQLEPVETAIQPAPAASPTKPVVKMVPSKSSDVYYRTASKLNKVKQNDPLGITEDAYKIKKVTEIDPFSDYEPDPNVAANDPCRNLCPRPEDCAQGENDEYKVCPEIEELTDAEYVSRHIPPAHYAWEAPNLYYNPLYFEDVQLERYGHTYWEPIQPFVSIGKFSTQLVGLPYQMAIDPPLKKVYPLGYYRPGECAPKLHYQIPWNTKAAAVQAGATAGAILLVP
ncbi:hypothetical protein Pla110_45890 [Polystyrenella longa]|uniref:Uncharacterized protein n=1 Tax=Polystyrenella longa TaxID=2528007 RepID=A0A518CUC9_9PLAN|nr:hypothetical protein Pla110_45890 [Polystyrenella longa]